MSFARVRRVTTLAVGFTAAASCGTLTCAYLYPDFRQNIERRIPQTKPIFARVLDSGVALSTPRHLSYLLPVKGAPDTPAVGHTAPSTKATSLPKMDNKPASIGRPTAVESTLNSAAERRAPVNISPVDVKKTHVAEAPTSRQPTRTKEDEGKLLSAIEKAEKSVKAASQAKYRTIEAIKQHSTALKKAVDDGKSGDWNAVSSALAQAEKLAKLDMKEEALSRDVLNSLQKVIATMRSSPAMAASSLVPVANETQKKLSHQLDELNHLAEKTRLEASVLNKYKGLVEQSRQQFASELKSILPGIDANATGSKLTEEEQNALLAHAHLRVDQLKRQLIEQQVQEEQKIAKAIEEQRLADVRLAEQQLKLELEHLKDSKDANLDKTLAEERKAWETELEKRLQRASLAHADHLESVIRTQKQLHDIENAKLVEEAVVRERNVHKKQVETAIAKLDAIESALESRVEIDAMGRRAKQFWIACQGLFETIVHGETDTADTGPRGKTLNAERLKTALDAIGATCEDDPFVQTLLDILSPTLLDNTMYTVAELKNRFCKVYTQSRRVAKIGDEGGGTLTRYILSYLQSLVTLEPPRRSPDKMESIDLGKPYDPYDLLARAKYFVEQGDFCTAVQTLNLLRGMPMQVAHDWILCAQRFEEVKLLAELLLAHASAMSIRSIH